MFLKNDNEDNLGDVRKCYLTLFEVDHLHLENCIMRLKAGSFCKVKNKEQGRGKISVKKKFNLLGPHSQACLGEGNTYRAHSGLELWGLADWIHCVYGQAEHLQGHEMCLYFSLQTWQPWKEWLHLSTRNLVFTLLQSELHHPTIKAIDSLVLSVPTLAHYSELMLHFQHVRVSSFSSRISSCLEEMAS